MQGVTNRTLSIENFCESLLTNSYNFYIDYFKQKEYSIMFSYISVQCFKAKFMLGDVFYEIFSERTSKNCYKCYCFQKGYGAWVNSFGSFAKCMQYIETGVK